jgi:hypothetical protein
MHATARTPTCTDLERQNLSRGYPNTHAARARRCRLVSLGCRRTRLIPVLPYLLVGWGLEPLVTVLHRTVSAWRASTSDRVLRGLSRLRRSVTMTKC